MSQALLLMAHGSRRATANADLVSLAELLRERGEYALIEIGYLELAEPTIPEGGRACVARGASEVRMLPYFLSAGNHVVEDLEAFRQQLATEFPHVAFTLCPPLGLHPLMLDIVLARSRETL